MEKLAVEIERYAFFLAYAVTHEIAHFLRYKNKVGKLYNKDFVKEKYTHPYSPEVNERYDQYNNEEENEAHGFLKRAFEFKKDVNIRTYDDIINLLSYSARHMPYFKNLQKRIKYEENNKEEFNLEDFRSTYGIFGRFGNNDF